MRLGLISSEGIGLVAISPERKMVSQLLIDEDTEIWIPGGYGWYRSGKLGKLLAQEGKEKEMGKVFFYNFGFWPTRILEVEKLDDWDNRSEWWSNLGLVSWVKYLRLKGGMVKNLVEIKGELDPAVLDTIMLRDFADSEIMNENIRLSVINTTDESGLAGFLASRLEWSGMTVMEVNNDLEPIESCQLVTGSEEERREDGWRLLIDNLNCETGEDGSLGNGEVELYLGQGYAEMLKYPSYVRSF